MKERLWVLVTWGSPERRKTSGRSGGVRPRCQSSLGRTEGFSDMTTPRSCREHLLPLESGSSGPSRFWRWQQGRKQKGGQRKHKEESRDSYRKEGQWVNQWIQQHLLLSCLLSFNNTYGWVSVFVRVDLTCEPPLWLPSLHLEFPFWCSRPELLCAYKWEIQRYKWLIKCEQIVFFFFKSLFLCWQSLIFFSVKLSKALLWTILI